MTFTISQIEIAKNLGMLAFHSGINVWDNPYYGMLDEDGNVEPTLRNSWFDGWDEAYNRSLHGC